MNREKLIFSISVISFAVCLFCFFYVAVTNYQERDAELDKACSAVNYELVTIKGRHYCLPFMPNQESE